MQHMFNVGLTSSFHFKWRCNCSFEQYKIVRSTRWTWMVKFSCGGLLSLDDPNNWRGHQNGIGSALFRTCSWKTALDIYNVINHRKTWCRMILGPPQWSPVIFKVSSAPLSPGHFHHKTLNWIWVFSCSSLSTQVPMTSFEVSHTSYEVSKKRKIKK